MDEKDLFDAWKQGTEQEHQVFEQHQDELSKLARKQSKDVFAKIKQNIIYEGIASVLVAFVFPFMFYNEGLYFWVMLIIMAIALYVSLKVYGRYWKSMKQLNESNIVDSLKKKLEILKWYVKQLHLYLYIFMPLGFLFGLSWSIDQKDFEWMRLLLLLAFSAPFLLLMMWLGKKYIYGLYGKHIKRIEEIYHNLTGNISEEV